MIVQALAEGFPWLRFEPVLERSFFIDRHRWLIARAVAVAWYALGMTLAYCAADYLFLPDSVFPRSIAIRVLFIAPFILLVIVGAGRAWPPLLFLGVYLWAYLVSGIGVIWIIFISRLDGFQIPYEGVLLIMMFGYLIMGLPFRMVLGGSMFLFALYALAEHLAGLPLDRLVYNSLFIVTANIIGAVGCYLQESYFRRNYLNQQLVEIARDDAQTQAESKARLLAAASHDLRQPLHAMTLFAESLEHRLPEGPERTTARHIQVSIHHLNRLLGSLLDMSRLQFGVIKPKYKRLELMTLIEQVVREVQHPDSTDVVIESATRPCWVRTDELVLTRILRNLIENAIEHADASRIVVRVDCTGAGAHLCVLDNGKGIPETEYENIFKEFHRITDRPHRGLGLGLAIVRQMAALLNLEVRIASRAGAGTTFSMILPKAEQLPEGTRQILRQLNNERGARILLAEDSPDIRASTQTLLQAWGYDVHAVVTVHEVPEALETGHYDLLITDYHFPQGAELTGGTLAYRVRARWPRLPIMVLTADTTVVLDDPALQPLILSFKPVKPAKLRLVLNHLLHLQ
jgi:signal transduction histidine kinase/CheY-like chemotaxis protein